MSTTRLAGPIGVNLGDDTVEAVTGTGPMGPIARLRIGEALTLYAANATPATLRQLRDAAEELAVWQEKQDAAAEVPAQVEAEDGNNRPMYVPFHRTETRAA